MGRDNQPFLEAGCGAGKWVAWAAMNGWQAIGVDWSRSLMEKAARDVPEARFIHGDMRDLPLESGSIGSVLSLGAVEHTPDGPEAALREFMRVLRPGGRALVTVPYMSAIRRAVWAIDRPLSRSPLLRRALRKPGGHRPLRREEHALREGWTPDFLATAEGWEFYEYQFTPSVMSTVIEQAGFRIEEAFAFAPDEGLINTFRRIAGRYEAGGTRLTLFGQALNKVLPEGSYEHMLGFELRKP